MDIKKIARVQKILSLILLVCFFFPFFTVSCGGEDITITGFDTVKGLNTMGEKEEGNPLCLLLLLIPLVIFLIIKFLNDTKKAFLYTALLGTADFCGLLMLKSGFAKKVNKAAGGLIEVKSKFGYSLSLLISLAIIILGIYGIYKLKDNVREFKDVRDEEVTEYCMNCGNPLLRSDRFCTKCGCSIGEIRNEPVPMPDIPPVPAQPEKIKTDTSSILIDKNEDNEGTQLIDIDDRTRIVVPKTIVKLLIRQEGNEINKEISDFPCIIGRSPEAASICIQDMSISRKHLSLDLADGKIMIQDLNSSNGVMLNGKKIQPEDLVLLSVNDVIKLGQAEIEIIDIGYTPGAGNNGNKSMGNLL